LKTAIKEDICLSEKKAIIKREKIEFLGFEVDTNGINLQPPISKRSWNIQTNYKQRNKFKVS